MSTDKEEYLGDGIYISFNGFDIRLRTSREDSDAVIYLEPAVYIALRKFAAQCWPPPEET